MIARIPFGKHRGTPISKIDPGYAGWLLKMGRDPGFHFADFVEDNHKALRAAAAAIPASADLSYTLADDQQQASDEALASLVRPGHIHRLQGGAGYGKSFAMRDIAVRLKREGFQVAAAATSFVATQNLSKDLTPIGVPCRTIASTFQLSPDRTQAAERYTMGPDTEHRAEQAMAEGSVMMIDEYSMVSDPIGQMLLDSCQRGGGSLLVVGDRYQLPSPEQSWDSMLCKVEPSSELTISKRFAPGSTLAHIEQLVRQNPLGFQLSDIEQGAEFRTVTSQGALDAFLENHRDRPDESQLMLFYRRADMVAANSTIRAQLVPDATEAVEAGETLRVQRTVFRYDRQNVDVRGREVYVSPRDQAETQGCSRLYSGTHLEVLEAEPGTHTIDLGDIGEFHIPCYWVRFENYGRQPVLFAKTDNAADPTMRGGAEFNAALKATREYIEQNLPEHTKNRWAPLYALRDQFLTVAYGYASTIHRVQGQSLDRVTVPLNLIRQVANYDPYTAAKLVYVAMTRAKKELLVY